MAVECATCGTNFERERWQVAMREQKGWANYCSTACRDAAKSGRKGTQRVERVNLKCVNCDKPFQVMPSELQGERGRRRKYCSSRCAAKHNGGQRPTESKTINSAGYAFVYVPKNERPPGQGHLHRHPEHRVVMAQVLGRWPTPQESVHHINGNRLDNRPENLQLRNGSHGSGHVLRCRCCGSSDIEYVELD